MALQTVTAVIEVCATIEGAGAWDEDARGRFYAYEPHTWGDLTVDIGGVTIKLSELPKEMKDALWDCLMEEIDDGKWEVQE